MARSSLLKQVSRTKQRQARKLKSPRKARRARSPKSPRRQRSPRSKRNKNTIYLFHLPVAAGIISIAD
jgi:hypothetical protein